MNIIQKVFFRFIAQQNYSVQGAIWMIFAGLCFAAINVITPFISHRFNINSSWIAFYQYLFAFILLFPSIIKQGIKTVFTTRNFSTHLWRIAVAVAGIQLWIKALSLQFPIGEGVALLMTSPLFASLGAVIFLKEKVTRIRVIATFCGFLGALIILKPNHQQFSFIAFLPLGAAFFWAIYSLLIKYLVDKDHPLTLLVYLYVLMIPVNLLIALTQGITRSSLFNFFLPDVPLLLYLGVLGLLTTLAQYAIVQAYACADALYIQPFDYLKLPLNTFLGWLFFGWIVDYSFWFGALIMLSSILAITWHETKRST